MLVTDLIFSTKEHLSWIHSINWHPFVLKKKLKPLHSTRFCVVPSPPTLGMVWEQKLVDIGSNTIPIFLASHTSALDLLQQNSWNMSKRSHWRSTAQSWDQQPPRLQQCQNRNHWILRPPRRPPESPQGKGAFLWLCTYIWTGSEPKGPTLGCPVEGGVSIQWQRLLPSPLPL